MTTGSKNKYGPTWPIHDLSFSSSHRFFCSNDTSNQCVSDIGCPTLAGNQCTLPNETCERIAEAPPQSHTCRAMLKLGTIMLGALASGAAAVPAHAQVMTGTNMELGGQRLAVSAEELRRLSDLGQALTATPAIQDRALAAARAVANSPDARHVLASYELEIAQQRHDDVMRAGALDVLIASRLTRPERIASYVAARGDIAWRAHDLALASALWTRAAEMQPDSPQALMNLAQVKQAQADPGAAADLIRRAIALAGRGSAAAPEIWYRQWLSIAYNGHQRGQTAAAGQALLAAYPTPANWRFALVAYRQLLTDQTAAEIDMLRLMRATRTFNQSIEYQRLAQLLLRAGLLAEARETLADGIARGVVDRNASPIPEIGREIQRAYARAEAQRRAPPSQLTRAGILAVAGDRADAEPILRTVLDAPSAQDWEQDIARFWLLWLARPA